MESSENLISWIKHHEGFRATAYIDDYAGTTRIEYSIGYGHQIRQNEDWLMRVTLTEDESDTILRNDLVEYEKYVNRYVTIPLTQSQFDALVNLNFAAGPGAVLNSKLYDAINAKNWESVKVIWGNLSVHYKGIILPSLVEMRETELSMFFSGIKKKNIFFQEY